MNIIEQQSDIDNKKTYEQNNILENIKKSSTLEEQLLHLTILDNAINKVFTISMLQNTLFPRFNGDYNIFDE